MLAFGPLDLLVLGTLAIFAATRVVRWMHRRGWVQWKPRGTSSALGNAVMQVQVLYQPQVREVLEQRLDERDEADDSGDPPPDPANAAAPPRPCVRSPVTSSARPSRCSAGSE